MIFKYSFTFNHPARSDIFSREGGGGEGGETKRSKRAPDHTPRMHFIRKLLNLVFVSSSARLIRPSFTKQPHEFAAPSNVVIRLYTVSPVYLPNLALSFVFSRPNRESKSRLFFSIILNRWDDLSKISKFEKSWDWRVFLPALFFFHEAPFRVERYRYEFSTGTNGIKDSFFCCVVRATNNDNRALFNVSVARTRTLVARPRKKAGYRVINNASLFFVNNFAVKILFPFSKEKTQRETLSRDYFSSPTIVTNIFTILYLF